MTNNFVNPLSMLDAEPIHRKRYRAAKLPFTLVATAFTAIYRFMEADLASQVIRSIMYSAVFTVLAYLFGFIELTSMTKTAGSLAGIFLGYQKLRQLTSA